MAATNVYPPQVLTIKRKRDAQPLEALFIETDEDEEKSPKRRRATRQEAYYFSRVHNDAIESQSPSINSDLDSVKTGNRDAPQYPSNEARSHQGHASMLHTATVARRFHIATSPSKRKCSAQHPRDKLVFVEETDGPVGYRVEKDQRFSNHQEERPQKRPSASTRTRRQANIGARWENAAATLYSEQQRVALNERDGELRKAMLKFAADSESLAPSVPPSKSNRDIANGQQKADDDEMDVDTADGDFVYDTFIRHLATGKERPASKDAVGYLVVPPDDTNFWSPHDLVFDNQSSSEPDWDSEQDDENAENFYGADYPEDELASDDEFGKAAYKYRGPPSDAGDSNLADEDLEGTFKSLDMGESDDGVDDENDAESLYRGSDDLIPEVQAYQAANIPKVKVRGATYKEGVGLVERNGNGKMG
ncbi:MAG: hypothetical protein M1828_006776 [Chrysothrix sp. TS-e1954]|nr:MAG: hypothetical protein M1828_006776 [Chrysothrix sp. TS-e1954]